MNRSGLIILVFICLSGCISNQFHKVKDHPEVMESFYMIEGLLVSVPGINSQKTSKGHQGYLEEGYPVGILSNKYFCNLLIDPKVLASLFNNGSSKRIRVRCYGMVHDHGRSMTPYRMTLLSENGWETVNLPYSGISGPASGGGDY